MTIVSIKKLDDTGYYDEIKNSNEMKQYDDLDEAYAEKKGFWYDRDGVYAHCFADGEIIAQVAKGDTSSLSKFAQGFNPRTGEILVEQKAGDTRRPGYDMTQSMPKAVSVLYSQSSPEVRALIEAAVLKSAKAGVDALNKYAGQTLAGKGGKDRVNCHYAAALYMDFTARPVVHPDSTTTIDPQLHVHTVLPNVTLCEDGKYRAIDGQVLMKAQVLMSQTCNAVLADEIQRLGFDVLKQDVGFGIGGIGQDVCDEFSRRSDQVEANRVALGVEDPTDATRGQLQAAKMRGRAHHSLDSKEAIEAHWAERAAAVGFSAAEAKALYDEAQARQGTIEPPVPTLKEAKAVLDKLLENESVMSDAKYRAACLGFFAGRGSLEAIEAIVNEATAQYAVVLGTDGPFAMISSQERCELEREMADIAVTHQRASRFATDMVDRVIADFKRGKEAEGKPMSPQQEKAVRLLAGSADGVVVMAGRAGAGKSYSIACLKAIADAGGWETTGVALSWAAARNLAAEGKLDNAAAIAELAVRIGNGSMQLHAKSLVIIDEAGIVGSRDMHTILRAAQEAGATVVLAGDPLQITSVAAGGAMRAIITEKQHHKKMPFAELTEVRRQEAEWDREAGLALAAGDAQGAIDAYIRNGRDDYDGQDLGRIKLTDNRSAMLDQVFADYIADRFDGTGKSQLVIAQTNRDVDALNLRIHQELQTRGIVGDDVSIVAGHKKPTTMAIAVGDEIQFRHKSKKLLTEDGEKIQVYNRTRAKVLGIEGSGNEAQLRVQLYDGDKLSPTIVQVSPRAFKAGRLPVEHSYVMTVDSAQGQTFDRSYVLGVDMKDRARAYVACTRHRLDMQIYGDKDTLHAIGAGRWSTSEYIHRSQFSDELAIKIMAQSWSRDRIKITTLDYTSEAFAQAKIDEEHLAATRNQLSQTLAHLKYNGLEQERAVSLNAVRTADRIWPANQHGYFGVEMPAATDSPEEKKVKIARLDRALATAQREWGADIKLTGSDEFIRLAGQRMALLERRSKLTFAPINERAAVPLASARQWLDRKEREAAHAKARAIHLAVKAQRPKAADAAEQANTSTPTRPHRS